MYHYQHYALDMDALSSSTSAKATFCSTTCAFGLSGQLTQMTSLTHCKNSKYKKVLLPEEVMGFDTRRIALLHNQPPIPTIQLSGTTPAERAQYLFEQLRQHGIPGGIVGEPRGLVTMFLNACENLVRDNRAGTHSLASSVK